MNTIYKYPLNVNDLVMIDMPEGAEVLTVQMQNDTPCIWAKVDDTKKNVRRLFRIYGTGHELDYSNLTYINTFQMENGMLVWHLFELNKSLCEPSSPLP